MSNKDYIDIFNDNVLDFFTQLTIYDNIVNFTAYRASIIASNMIDKHYIRKTFHDTVVVYYSDKILNKEEAFFLEQSYDTGNPDDISIINSIKKIWMNIDQENKNKIWDYLNVLVYLNNKIVNQQK